MAFEVKCEQCNETFSVEPTDVGELGEVMDEDAIVLVINHDCSSDVEEADAEAEIEAEEVATI